MLRTSGGHNLLDIVVLAVDDVLFFFRFFFSLCGSERGAIYSIKRYFKKCSPPPLSLSLPSLTSRMWHVWTLSNTEEKKDH